MDLQLVGHLRGQMLVLQDWYGRDASLRWDGPSMKVQDFWSPGAKLGGHLIEKRERDKDR